LVCCSARNVIAPAAGDPVPFSSIPHAPFHWSDAWLLIAIVAALLALIIDAVTVFLFALATYRGILQYASGL
jgi:hypothetical protein